MILLIILYLTGCVLAWFIVAFINDKTNLEMPAVFIITSWFCITVIIIIALIESLSKKISKLPYPSLKRFKKKP